MDARFYILYDTPEQRTRAFQTLERFGYKFYDRFGTVIKLTTLNQRYPMVHGLTGVFLINVAFKRFFQTQTAYIDYSLKSFKLPNDDEKLVRYCKGIENKCVKVNHVGAQQQPVLVTPTNVILGLYEVSYANLRQLERAIKAYKVKKELQHLVGFTRYEYAGYVYSDSFRVGCQTISHKKWREVLEAVKTVAPKKYAMIVR
jgi:hypothetical protein